MRKCLIDIAQSVFHDEELRSEEVYGAVWCNSYNNLHTIRSFYLKRKFRIFVLKWGQDSNICSKLMLKPGLWWVGLNGGLIGTPEEFSAGNSSGSPARTSNVNRVLKIGAITTSSSSELCTGLNWPPQYLHFKEKGNEINGGPLWPVLDLQCILKIWGKLCNTTLYSAV